MKALSSVWLINQTWIELEHVCLTKIWNLRTVCKHIELNWIPIQASFWKFLCVPKIYLNFETFWKKRSDSQLKYLRCYWPQKTRLVKCLKKGVWKHPSASNLLTCPKHSWNMHEIPFIFCFIILRGIELENVSLSQIWNLKTVC